MLKTVKLLENMGLKWKIKSQTIIYFERLFKLCRKINKEDEITVDEIKNFISQTKIVPKGMPVSSLGFCLSVEDEEHLNRYLSYIHLTWDDSRCNLIPEITTFKTLRIQDDKILSVLKPGWEIQSLFLNSEEKVKKQISILCGVVEMLLERENFTEKLLQCIKEDIITEPNEFQKELFKRFKMNKEFLDIKRLVTKEE